MAKRVALKEEADLEVFSRGAATKHWKSIKRKWVADAKQLEQDLLALEDKPLRWAVAAVLDIAAEGYCSAVLTEDEGAFTLRGFLIDPDLWKVYADSLKEMGVDPKETTNRAKRWLETKLEGKKATYVGWLMQKVTINSVSGRKVTAFSDDRIVYSVTQQKIRGVETVEDPSHPRYRIIRVLE